MTRLRYLGAAGLLLAAGALTACASGPSENDMQALQDQLQAEQQKSAALQEQLSEMEAGAADQEEAMMGEGEGEFVLLSGNYGPTAEPPPPPTPPPADFVAPTRPPPPDSLYDPVGPYSFYVETLATTHVSDYGYASDVSCIQSGTFRRGMRIVWRFEVIDMATGKRITDLDEDTKVTVLLPNGEELEPHFSQRGAGRVPDAPFMWSANWDIPLDHPLGGLDYVIHVEKDDGTVQDWHVPAVTSEESDSMVQIIN